MEITVKRKGLFLVAVLVLCTACQLFSYGGNTAVAPLLQIVDGYELYSLVASLGSAGMMISLPAVGALTSRIGTKSVLILGCILMLIGRLAMLFAWDAYSIAIFNIIGSFGNGMIVSAPFALIGTAFDRKSSIKYYGYIATFNAIGALIGPPLAGLLVDAGMPRIAFITWIPLFVIMLVIICMTYPTIKSDQKVKFDVPGWIYLAIAVLALVLWLTLSGSAISWVGPGLLFPVVVIVFLIILIKHSKKVPNPTVPISMFKRKNFSVAFLSNCCVVVFSTCASGYLLNYLLYVMNTSATLGSTTTVPSTIVITICGLFLGRILAKNFIKNVRTMTIIGSFCTAAALLLFSLLQPDSNILQVWIGSALGGLGNAISQTCLTPFFQHGLPLEDYQTAQGMYTFSGTGMATIFVAIVGALVTISGGDIKMVFYTGLLFTIINIIICIAFVKIKDVVPAENQEEATKE